MLKGTKRHGNDNQRIAYLFLAPSLIVFVLFSFIPLAGAFIISLTDIDIYMNKFSFVGIQNYLQAFKDSRVINASINTVIFTITEVPLQVGLALLILMFMLKNSKIHKAMRTIFYLPYVCSMTAISIVWSMLINPNSGILPYLFGKIGINMPNLLHSTTWAMPTVVMVSVWKGFGYTLTLLSAAALGVSQSLYEAADIDGANSIQKFFYVTIPGIKNTIGFCLVTTVIIALQVFDQIYIMTNGGPQYKTETLVGYIYNRGFQTAPFNLGYASSIAVYLFVVIALITCVMRKYTFRQGEDE